MIVRTLVKIIILFVCIGSIPILAYNIKDLILTLIRPCNYKKETDTSGKIPFIWKYTLWYLSILALLIVALAGIVLAIEIREVFTH
mgnify:FL=1